MSSSPKSCRIGLFALAIAVLGGAGIAAYFLWPRSKPVAPPDMTAAMVANSRGVGRMERFEYAEAGQEFEEAARLAPDWVPAKVNLAIALFNQDTPETLLRSRNVLTELVANDPTNKHAHYCLGVICSERGPFPEAHAHFLAVNKLDPEDAYTWLRLGITHPAGTRSAEARDCFEQALKRSPYLNAARYNLLLILYDTDPERAKQFEAEFKDLKDANWETESATVYGVMGKYADVIGRDAKAIAPQPVGPLPLFRANPQFRVMLAPNAKWATLADLDPLRRSARERFGGTIVLFDFNGDGRTDILLLAAVVENGKVRDLLLRNDGNATFTDVTAMAGLAGSRLSLGAAAGDYDNDGFPDLAITGSGEQHLFHNKGDGTFEDVSAAAGLNQLKGVVLGCGWVDLDQDGDLDLVLCKYADATDSFTGTAPKSGGTVAVFENIGEALPVLPNARPPGLTTKFVHDAVRFKAIFPPEPAVAFVASDLDGDRDVDLLLLTDRAKPVVVDNERLLRLRRTNPNWQGLEPRLWNGGLVLDANHDERSDLFLIAADAPPVLLLSKGEREFVLGRTNSPPLKQAVTADVDFDGWPDVVGLAVDGKAMLLHNQGDGRLEYIPDAFGAADQLPKLVRALACADFDGDETLDLLLWSDDGLQLRSNGGNGNRAIAVSPTGRRDKGSNQRTNSDGIGSWLIAQAGPHWTGAERTTVSAGLGQSLLPTVLGLGKNAQADAVRIHWPDAVIQAELGVNAGPFRVAETNRKGTSCPVLMAWDGEKFAFVTDFLGAGAIGESGTDGSVRPPRPEESVKIEPGQLRPKGGKYLLKIAEPMDEVLYLDRVRLDVLDVPSGTTVLPDERFAASGPQPSQELLAFKTRYFPTSAMDHRGRDVTKLLLQRDRRAVDSFAVRSWLGYAEDHSLALDFGTLPNSEPRRWFLVLAGWTEYPYPESIYAATRAGVSLDAPVLERQAPDGTWKLVCELGFPAGLSRVMTKELPDFAASGPCALRIRTNMQVYWDQIYLAPAESIPKPISLDPERATLAKRGFMQEVYPEGRPPVAYDDAKTEPVVVTKWKGNLTRLGDVTDLVQNADDRFAICGPGDEVTVQFDATKLPELKPGWERSFVLRTWGYCKDTSPTTVTGGSVGPLPFRGMANYPDFGTANPPTTDAKLWHTRPAAER